MTVQEFENKIRDARTQEANKVLEMIKEIRYKLDSRPVQDAGKAYQVLSQLEAQLMERNSVRRGDG